MSPPQRAISAPRPGRQAEEEGLRQVRGGGRRLLGQLAGPAVRRSREDDGGAGGQSLRPGQRREGAVADSGAGGAAVPAAVADVWTVARPRSCMAPCAAGRVDGGPASAAV